MGQNNSYIYNLKKNKKLLIKAVATFYLCNLGIGKKKSSGLKKTFPHENELVKDF